MERRFQTRLRELLDDAIVPSSAVREVMPRLEEFLEPFLATMRIAEQRVNGKQYITGLLSELGSKDAESIAYLHDRERQGMQKFIGQSEWDHRPLISELVKQVASELGEADGVLVFDPSAFEKKGVESVGVKRQWCGRLGKIENCQVGVYMGYVSNREHAIADFRLYLPKEWARDKRRRKKAGVPKEVRFQTRHEQALEMLNEHGQSLPHMWVAGDDELGRSSPFRRELRTKGEQYLLCVPSNTLVRDLAAPAPPWSGHGAPPKAPFRRVDQLIAALPETQWTTIEVRDGEKGPIITQAVRFLVQARTERNPDDSPEFMIAFRERQENGDWKHDYALAFAPIITSLVEFARVFKARNRIEDAFKRAKSEAGLADYQGRTWLSWHHHQALSVIATWFLTREARRKKNSDARNDCSTSEATNRQHYQPGATRWPIRQHSPQNQSPLSPQRRSTLLPLETTQTVTAATT